MEKLAQALWQLEFELDFRLFDEPEKFSAIRDELEELDKILVSLQERLTSELPIGKSAIRDRDN